MSVTLWCLIVDDTRGPLGNSFPVTVVTTASVEKLTKKILTRGPTELKELKLKAPDLLLCKPNDDFRLAIKPLTSLHSNVSQLRLDRKSGKEASNKAALVNPSSTIKRAFCEPLLDNCVHVLVQPRQRQARGQQAIS